MSLEPLKISVAHAGRSFLGEYRLDRDGEGFTYLTVSCDGFGSRTELAIGLEPEWLAKEALGTLIRLQARH